MAKNAQISIIIPVYNRAKIVKDTLDSVASQTLRPLDVILIDNNSSDSTLEVLNEWKKQTECDDFNISILSETTPGAAAARNRGLKEVTTPYTMFFDSDDIMLPTHAERAVEAFNQDASLDVVGWDVDTKTLSGNDSKYRFCDKDTLYNHIFHATMATQRFAARTELFKQVGGWGENLIVWNDYELGVRLILANPTIKKLTGKASVIVIAQRESITGTNFSSKAQYWEASLNAIDIALDKYSHSSMKKYIDVRRVILAGFYHREGAIQDSKRLLGEVVSRSGWYRRIIMKLFYNIIRCGGRGIALLAKPLLYFSK